MFNFFKKSEEKQEDLLNEKIEQRDEKLSFGLSFSQLREKISKTSESLVGSVVNTVINKQTIDDDTIDEIEEKLISADLGLDTAVEICQKLRENKHKIAPDGLKAFLKEEFYSILNTTPYTGLNIKENSLNIILITGVNGVGKTTLIGKLAHRFKVQGKKVLVAAGDTYRAAAEEQLEIWSKRAGAQIVRKDGAQPSAVVYEAIEKAKREDFDILLIDTAGRLQNKFNLMEELGKIKRTIDKNAPQDLVESMLVIDATTGQNGLQQAKVFKEAVDLTSVALTKLDGSAKGGIVIAISKELHLPVKLIGVGEKLEDLKDFNSNDFIDALFE